MSRVQTRPEWVTQMMERPEWVIERLEHPEPADKPEGRKKGVGIGVAVLRYATERRDRGEITAASAVSYRGILWAFAEAVGTEKSVKKITRRDVERWLERARVGAATKRHRLGVVRHFFTWCQGYDMVKRNPTTGMGKVPQPRRVPRGLKHDEVTATLSDLPNTRAEVIILLECQEGLRAKEVAGLQLGDFDRREGTILVRGKGGHERVLPLSEETTSAIRRYLGEYPTSAGPLVRSFTAPNKPISAHYVSVLASQWLHGAGVDATGHALRHTAATDMLRRSGNLLGVRDALGHVSIATTQQYLGVAAVDDLRSVMGGRTYKETGR